MGWIHLHREVGYRHDNKLSAVGNAAYIHREKGYDAREGRSHDWTGDESVTSAVSAARMMPGEGAPAWVKRFAENGDVVEFWNEVERREDAYLDKRYRRRGLDAIDDQKVKALIYSKETIALPVELNRFQNMLVVDEYVKSVFTDRGITVQYAIHWDEGNPHVHLMRPVRIMMESGVGPRTDDFGKYGDRRARLLEARRAFTEIGNRFLVRNGFEPRLDYRSYEAQGVRLEPTAHEGWQARRLQSEGKYSRISSDNADIRERNRAAVAVDPDIIIAELSSTNATFTEQDLKNLLFKRVEGDIEAFAQIAPAMMASPLLVAVGEDAAGRVRFSTEKYSKMERAAFEQLRVIAQRQRAGEWKLGALRKRLDTDFGMLSVDQRQVIEYVIAGKDVVNIVGLAGTGKTTILKAVAQHYDTLGFRVRGMSVAGIAAENLEREAGIKSSTVDSFLVRRARGQAVVEQLNRREKQYAAAKLRAGIGDRLKKGQRVPDEVMTVRQDVRRLRGLVGHLRKDIGLSSQDVIVLDEAGMAGTKHMAGVIRAIHDAGARLVLVGDQEQLKAVAAGSFFRKAVEEHGSANLTNIIRQKVSWQNLASQAVAAGEVRTAIESYEKAGRIHQYDTDKQARGQLVDAYVKTFESSVQEGDGFPRQLALAFTNDDVNMLNAEIRKRLEAGGHIKSEIEIAGTAYGSGDRIVFLKNDAAGRFVETVEGGGKGTKNGSTGVVTGIETERGGRRFVVGNRGPDTIWMHVTLDGSGRKIRFNPFDNGPHFQHGFAVTIHKAQGQTVDRSFLLPSLYMRSDAAYVSLTRHRHDIDVFTSRSRFAGTTELATALGAVNDKDVVADYTQKVYTPEDQYFMTDYLETRRNALDLITRIAEKSDDVFEDQRYKEFDALREKYQHMARTIVDRWSDFERIASEVGLRKERAEIDAGATERPLTEPEKRAVAFMQDYRDMSMSVRDMWNHIKSSHPGAMSRTHPDYLHFDKVRDERNEAAAKIVRERKTYFRVKSHANLSWETIVTHAQQHEVKSRRDSVFRSLHQSEVATWSGVVQYVEHAKMASLHYGNAKREAQETGRAVWHTHAFKLFQDESACRDSAAKVVVGQPGVNKIAEVHGLRSGVLAERAAMCDARETLHLYKAALQNDPSSAARIAVKLFRDDQNSGKARAKVKSLAREAGLDWSLLEKTAVRQVVNDKMTAFQSAGNSGRTGLGRPVATPLLDAGLFTKAAYDDELTRQLRDRRLDRNQVIKQAGAEQLRQGLDSADRTIKANDRTAALRDARQQLRKAGEQIAAGHNKDKDMKPKL